VLWRDEVCGRLRFVTSVHAVWKGFNIEWCMRVVLAVLLLSKFYQQIEFGCCKMMIDRCMSRFFVRSTISQFLLLGW
jgi:hypothetical protein